MQRQAVPGQVIRGRRVMAGEAGGVQVERQAGGIPGRNLVDDSERQNQEQRVAVQIPPRQAQDPGRQVSSQEWQGRQRECTAEIVQEKQKSAGRCR